MKDPNNEEDQEGHQQPAPDSSKEEQGKNGTENPDDANHKEAILDEDSCTRNLTALPVMSVRLDGSENKQVHATDAGIPNDKKPARLPVLEIVVKSAAPSDVKSEEKRGAKTGATKSTKNAAKTFDSNGIEEDSDKKKTKEAKPSLRALRRSRAAWHAMQFPEGFETVFKNDSDADTDSDSDSDSDSSESSSDSDSDSHSNTDSDKKAKPSGQPRKPDDASSWAAFVVDNVRPEDVKDDSASRLEWLRQKRDEKAENPILDQLMGMTGRENVKAHFLAVKARVEASKRVNVQKKKLRFHLVLVGKDGTGKKSIAQLYARFLVSIGVLSRENFLKTSKDAPGHHFRGLRQGEKPNQPEPKKPTVVLYDTSAYDDTKTTDGPRYRRRYYDSDDSDEKDSDEVEKLLKIAKKSVLIISTRADSLIKSMQSNERALREFQTAFTLSDYTKDEIRAICLRMLKKRGLSLKGSNHDAGVSTLVRRVMRDRESKTFSNVHRLAKELDDACRRRDLRLQQEYTEWFGQVSNHRIDGAKPHHDKSIVHDEGDYQTNSLTFDDLIGCQPKNARIDNKSWKKLQEMIGLDKVKGECGHVIDLAQFSFKRELQGIEPLKISLNRLFLGPPGVGKTTVAQLYGQLLIDLGLVSGSEVMLTNPADFIGMYVGHSEANTKELLDKAKGNVLIIDDAHMLYPGSTGAGHSTDVFRIAVLDTIVANVSADPEDRAIILVGYEHEMEQLFLNSNPGLQRRFPKESALHFESYSEDELHRIMDLKIAKSDLTMTEQARKVSQQVLNRMRINPKFGNAGDVENLVGDAKVRMTARLRNASSGGLENTQFILEPEDIDPYWDRFLRAGENRAALFEDFVGFEKIVERFEGYQHLVDGMRLHGADPKPHMPWAFIFKGPPGSGKTSTARKVGQLYYDLGLLSQPEVVTCSVSELVSDSVGETGPKVLNVLDRGLGKVLFIDEAYRLAMSGYHMIAVGELVDAMTQPRYQQNMVVILAGYTKEMELLVRINPGIRSRFPEQVTFRPMSPRQCYKLLRQEIGKMKISITKGPGSNDLKMRRVHELFGDLSRTKGWASGRDIGTLAKGIIGNVYMQQGRYQKSGMPTFLYITLDELIDAITAMRRQREKQDSGNESDGDSED